MLIRCYAIALFSFLIGAAALGQSLEGVWKGPLSAPNQPALVLQSVVTLRMAGGQLTGDVSVQANGTTDTYRLQGTVNGPQATGRATYPTDGSVFQFEAALKNGQLLFAVGQNGTALMTGTLTRGAGIPGAAAASGSLTGSANPGRSSGNTPHPNADGLYRDPALVGSWRTSTNYGGGVTDSGFYGSTSSTIILNADGTLGDGGSSGYASGSNVSVESSSGSSGPVFKQLAAAGARWFTKGNLVYVRLRVNGHVQDVPASKYFVENNRMLITDLKTGRKTLYVRP